MEIETNKINFSNLYKITVIDLDTVTFKKYEINRNSTIISKIGIENVELGKEIGIEIHKCKPEIIGELAGKVGIIVIGFEVQVTGKSKKRVAVNKILYL